ncbi:zinc finger protein 771-like [Anabrus simplex]|uniref:zinc finger protein 771-like n=1 Tax=Anabrus simplex TaxID=316456 RepID=UPI0035A2CF6D
MDQKIEIKKEPVWLEDTAGAYFDNYKITSEEMHLKEEPKSELAEPGETQASIDIKDEICMDEHAVGQLVACFKEEDKHEIVALLTAEHSDDRSIYPSRNKVSSKPSLQKQILTQSSESPKACDLCGKTFASKSSVWYHRRTHTRPHSCNVCGKKFSFLHVLQRHLLIHTGLRPHSCSTCGKKFSTPENLRRHMRIHTAERPYKCDVCGNTFFTKQNLAYHLPTHTDERPHSCKV